MRRTDVVRLRVALLVQVLLIIPSVGWGSGRVEGSGILEISTNPSAEVFWEGIPLGPTDESGRMTISSIPLGSYSITLSLEGLEPVTRQVVIGPGHQELTVSLRADTLAAFDGESHSTPSLPDPFAKSNSSLIAIALPALLVLIASGALWLGRRRRWELDDEMPPSPDPGPRVVLAEEPRGRPRPPRFYEDLRQRETILENREERGSERARPKIIELPVADSRRTEDG